MTPSRQADGQLQRGRTAALGCSLHWSRNGRYGAPGRKSTFLPKWAERCQLWCESAKWHKFPGPGLDVDESGGRPSGRLALQGPLPKQPSSHQPISSLGPRRVGPPRSWDVPAWNRGVGLQLAITVPRAVHGDCLSAGPSWEARGGLENALGDERPRPCRNARCGGSCATVKGRQVAVVQQTWAVGSSGSGVMAHGTSHWFSIATVE